MESISVQACRICGAEHPKTAEFFATRPSRDRRFRDLEKRPARVTRLCRPCSRIKSKRSKERQKGREPLETLELKECRACGVNKPSTLEHFQKCTDRLAGLRPVCRQCLADKARARYWANPEKRRQASLQWAKDNPDKKNAYNRNRVALRRQSEGQHTGQDVQRQIKAQQGKCYWCRAQLILVGTKKYHVDHLIPLSRGGSNGPENIVCACQDCNLSRNNKLPHEWNGRLL